MTAAAGLGACWPAAGVFRQLVHRVDVDEHPQTFTHNGLMFWWAACGVLAIPTDRPQWSWARCPVCWDLSGER